MNSVQQLGVLVVDTFITLYIFILIARALLEASQAEFYNPISQLIYKMTQPVLRPLRQMIPAKGTWDIGCWLLVYALYVSELLLLRVIISASWPLVPLLVLSAIQVLEWVLQFYAIAIIISAIASWFLNAAQIAQNALLVLIHSIVTPILNPVRRLLPSMGMFDFSPLVVLAVIYWLLQALKSFYS